MNMPEVFLVKELVLKNVEILHFLKPGRIIAYVIIEDCRRHSSLTDYPHIAHLYDEGEWESRKNFFHAQIVVKEDIFSKEEKDVLSEMVMIYMESRPSVDTNVTFTIYPKAFSELTSFDDKPSIFFEELLKLTEEKHNVSNVTNDSLNYLTQI
ncbi:hypothetical protein [Psychrobacillus sp.]|uniref:hypothetical protein n=1 Tax=Psychrobacillus sp. TaxID=1871623 RepID=UPI0028BF4258|nr:hypothetical protein [Psychrobacillus sp.]